MKLSVLTIFLLLLLDLGQTYDPLLMKKSEKDLGSDKCFCQLEGKIDDCMCNVDTVDYFNNMKIFPRLQSLLQVNQYQKKPPFALRYSF